jgi:hypothetical protein
MRSEAYEYLSFIDDLNGRNDCREHSAKTLKNGNHLLQHHRGCLLRSLSALPYDDVNSVYRKFYGENDLGTASATFFRPTIRAPSILSM